MPTSPKGYEDSRSPTVREGSLSTLQKSWLRSNVASWEPSLTVGPPLAYAFLVFLPPDADNFPLAYLITFRSYGTWLHGDERGSVDRKHNVYGTPRIHPNCSLKEAEERQLRHSPVILNGPRRQVIMEAIREVCRHRGYNLLAVNVRTNHVHSVIAAACKPDPILNALKAYATRKLRRHGLIPLTTTPWVRKGSKRWLWKERDVNRAIAYVMFEQGEDPFE